MNEKKITTRQLVIFFCIYSFSLKFLGLPQLLSQGAAQDAWIAAIIGTVLELLILFAVLHVLTLGKRTPRFVFPFMLVLFFLQLLVLIGVSNQLVTQNLFPDMSLQTFLIPLVLFGMMFCLVSGRAIFRGGEIFYLLIIIGLALSVLPAIPKMQFGQLAPVGASGFGSIMYTVFRNLIFFESAAFLLVFSGDIKITKRFRTKFMTVAGIIGFVFVFFVLMTTTLFGPLGPYKSIAIVDLTAHASFLTQGGRADWLLVCIWLLLIMMRFGVMFACVFMCIRQIFNIKKNVTVYIASGIAVTLWAVYSFAPRLEHLAVDIIVAVLMLLVPLTCFIWRGKKNV